MGLKNTITGEYIKIDFGYLPAPIAKKFRSQEQRNNFNTTFDKFEKVEFDLKDFNQSIKTAFPDSTKTLVDNFKTLAYSKIKQQLNIPIKSIDEDGNEIEVENIIWEDC